jgi:hypothetical protein
MLALLAVAFFTATPQDGDSPWLFWTGKWLALTYWAMRTIEAVYRAVTGWKKGEVPE